MKRSLRLMTGSSVFLTRGSKRQRLEAGAGGHPEDQEDPEHRHQEDHDEHHELTALGHVTYEQQVEAPSATSCCSDRQEREGGGGSVGLGPFGTARTARRAARKHHRHGHGPGHGPGHMHGPQSTQSDESDGGYSSSNDSSRSVSPQATHAPQASQGFGNTKMRGSGLSTNEDAATNPDWASMPSDALVCVFRLLRTQDLGRCAQVCSDWRRATQDPRLWRRAEFVLSNSPRPATTSPSLVNFILDQHAQHLKFVVLRTDSSAESAQSACHILSRLVNCSLKTLALMSGAARPVFLDVDQQQFASALTLVLDHSPTLRALAVDNTLVDDPSLQALANSNSHSLQRLLCKSCPRLSPGGVLALVDHCRCLRELSLSYTLLSDDLLLALSSELHARLEVLRVDVYSDADSALRPIAPSSWRALVAHSPQLNLVMYLFAIHDECFDTLFKSYIPVTHLYFGDYVPNFVLGRVGQHCPQLVELVVGANGNSLIDQQLLDIGTNCQQLSSMGLAECQVTCSSFVRFAEACGPRLSQLVVMDECLIEDSAYDLATTCVRISEIMGREWSPEFMPMW